MKTYVVTPYKNRLDEPILMMGHNIRFKGVIWKIIPILSLLPLLSWSTGILTVLWVELNGGSLHTVFHCHDMTQILLKRT